MTKRPDHEGEELLPEKDPGYPEPPEKEIDPMPDRELEYEENSNEKYRDYLPDEEQT